MASWKKVIVSGSAAHLSSVTASNIPANDIVVASTGGALSGSGLTLTGGTLNLGSTNITSTGNASSLSGSFSGSFFGNGSGLSGIAASFPTIQITDLSPTNQFFVNDGASKYITYSDLIADLAGTNLTSSDSGDSLALSPNITLTSVTASFTGSLTGELIGTSSWAYSASNAVNAQTASYVLAGNVVGLSLNQISTGSVTASVNVGTGNVFTVTSASITEFAVAGTGVTIGSALTDSHRITGSLGVTGSVTISNDLTVNGTTFSVPNIGAGTTDTVIIRDGSNNLATRLIDSRVWGTTLISGSGTPGQVAFFDATTGITSSAGFTFASNILTAPNLTVTNNLIVQGTASFQETTNLAVADRFILLASGSNSANEGGIVVQQSTNGVGEVFGWDDDTKRWAVTSSFTANQSTFAPDAFMAAVVIGAGTDPTTTAVRYSAAGNIFIGTGPEEAIWIYS